MLKNIIENFKNLGLIKAKVRMVKLVVYIVINIKIEIAENFAAPTYLLEVI